MRRFLIPLVGISIVTMGCQSKQEKAIEAVEKLGGFCKTDNNRPGQPVVTVFLYNRQATDKVMPYLDAFPELETLDLQNAHITDKGLENLKKMTGYF